MPDRNPGRALIVAVTTITDPHELALELAGAYQQRWEEESGRGEVLRPGPATPLLACPKTQT